MEEEIFVHGNHVSHAYKSTWKEQEKEPLHSFHYEWTMIQELLEATSTNSSKKEGGARTFERVGRCDR